MNKRCRFFLVLAILLLLTPPGSCSDWPMWGFDRGRSNTTPAELSTQIELIWTRQLPEPAKAWPFQYEDYYTVGNPQEVGKLSFDISYEPVSGAGMLFVPSMVSDSVTAYCAGTGDELWSYHAGGPVRFAPVYAGERLYFVSDDGYLYCVKAASGELAWRFNGSFSGRMVLGNERLISAWPARGGPVLSEGVVYFAAGVLPFEGIFVHAVCAETGEKIWTNSASGAAWELHQHGGAWSFGGPSPQGYLAISGDRLIVPGGRTPPAVFDRKTGELLYFRMDTSAVGKGAGGYRVHASDKGWFFNHGMFYNLEDGAQYGRLPGSVLTEDAFIGLDETGRLIGHSSKIEKREAEIQDRLSRGAIRRVYEVRRLWRDEVRGINGLYFRAGSLLGVSTEDGKAVILALGGEGNPCSPVWEHEIEGRIWNMFPAAGKLFIVTECGKIYCFGEAEATASARHLPVENVYDVSKTAAGLADEIVSFTGKEEGYAYVFGGDVDLLMALAERTELRIIALSYDESSVERSRRRLVEGGFYGARVALLDDRVGLACLPPYLAELIVLKCWGDCEEDLARAFNLLRPYGGRIYMADPGDNFREAFDKAGLDNGTLKEGGSYAIVTREGSLPGAGKWTHQYGSAANRTYSGDDLVRPPLGAAWFGGPSNLKTLPRHHNGPIPQVAGGRLFILGIDTLSARCVYTGRELWVKEIPGIGHPFTCLEHEEIFRAGREVYMPNHPGANFIGSPYVSVEDGVYVIHKNSLLHIDPASGRTINDFRLPPGTGLKRNEWGHVMVWGNYLIAAADPQFFDDGSPGKESSWNATSSSLLLIIDRKKGNVLWTRESAAGFRHNAIAAGNGRLYVIDGLSGEVRAALRRRGVLEEEDAVLFSLDIGNGDVLWSREGAFGTWLGYYEDKDILIEGGRHGQRRPLRDEPRDNLVAYSGDGAVLWDYVQRYSGPLGLHEDMVIPGNPGERALNPVTGEALNKSHPLTGEDYTWSYHRYYGCGTMNASRHLVMFRSGAAGFADLSDFGGTANLSGFKAGCTNNLIAADGVLNCPDYTRTCTCSYQLQTSLGLVHMPEAELWTLNRLPPVRSRIKSVGINFGAPGNRRENGVLWLEYPKIYAAGPDVSVSVEGNSVNWFRNHASWIINPSQGHSWVASYGMEGVERVIVALAPPDSGESLYDVTLYFAEPEDVKEGERVFSVFVQDERAAERLDVVDKAGGPRRVLKVVAPNISVEKDIEITFVRERGSLPPVISGIEIVETR